MAYRILTAEAAAALVSHGEVVGLSGFTTAGAPKVFPAALAAYARAEHEAGREFKVQLMLGASCSSLVEGVLADAEAIDHLMPYQGCPESRAGANGHGLEYVDAHLSLMAQQMRYGHLPRVTTAVVEVCQVTEEGELTLTTGVGNTPTFCRMADRLILELNSYHRPELRTLHDIYIPADPPCREPFPLARPDQRIGSQTLRVDPTKIVGIIQTHTSDQIPPFRPVSEVTAQIGRNLVGFLEEEYRIGRIPRGFLPVQSGVGHIANAVLDSLRRSELIPPFQMYTEVIQDTVIRLMKEGRCLFASGCSLTVSDEVLEEIYAHFDFFRDKILLRPQEISNHPDMARRIGLICMNTALEVDVCGNVNSTHIGGNQVMNGVGGSGDFARSAAYTIFTCPSVAKGGSISSIVPMVCHTDHPEHDVDVIVTEQGVADLRFKSPRERAACIVENCAHPRYRDLLRQYLALTPEGHSPHCLSKAFAFHEALMATGDMGNARF